jgi:hypothetical protein
MVEQAAMNRKGVILAAAAFLIAGLTGCAPPARYKIVTLRTGQQLKALPGYGPLYSAETHKVLGLMVPYETDIDLNDMPALAHEADLIFADVRSNAEHGGYTSVILSATSPPSGLVFRRSKGYRFVYVRDSSGDWKRTNGPK